jgi:hypothetical protein
MMEIHWEASAREVTIRGLRWVHPKKITFWGFADSQGADERGSDQRHRPAPLRVSLSPLSGPFRLRHLGRDNARVRLDVLIQELCGEGLGELCGGVRDAGESWQIRAGQAGRTVRR